MDKNEDELDLKTAILAAYDTLVTEWIRLVKYSTRTGKAVCLCRIEKGIENLEYCLKSLDEE